MKKYWIVVSQINNGKFTQFESYQDAADEAARMTREGPVDILELVARTRVPVPKIEIETFAGDRVP